MGRLGGTGRDQTGTGQARGGTERRGITGVAGKGLTGPDEATVQLGETELTGPGGTDETATGLDEAAMVLGGTRLETATGLEETATGLDGTTTGAAELTGNTKDEDDKAKSKRRRT